MRSSKLFKASLFAALLAISTIAPAAPPPNAMTFTARLADSAGPLGGSHNFSFSIFAAATGGTALWTETHSGVLLDEGLVSIGLGSSTPITSAILDGTTRFLEVTVDGTALDERVPLLSVPFAIRAGVAAVAEGLTPALEASLDADYLPKGSTLSCNAGAAVTALTTAGNVTCSTVQMPLANACTAGQFLRSFSAAGAPTCSAITLADLAGIALPTENIQDQAINSEKIKDGSVSLADLAGDAVDSSKIVDGSITSADLGANAVTSAAIANGTITGLDIATDAIGASHIAANSVSSAELVDGSITSTELSDSSVTSAKIVDGTIAAADIGSNVVGAQHIGTNALNMDEVTLPMFASHTSGTALVSGNNDIFVPQTLVPTTTGTCMVLATLRLSNQGAQATGSASLRVVWRSNGGAASTDVASGSSVAGAFGPSGDTHLFRSFVVPVVASATYEFGCRANASGDYIGDVADCQVSVMCQ